MYNVQKQEEVINMGIKRRLENRLRFPMVDQWQRV